MGLRAPLSAAAGTLAATGLVAAVDPAVSGRYPPCPFLTLTGCACPLCGGLRAVHALTRLDVSTALTYNALVPPVVLVVIAFWGFWIIRAARGLSADVSVTRWTYRVVVVLGVIFTILRNLPGLQPLLPG
ncbi:MAG: DUF2752 domain-containing protein [Dermatophilaceae bacterium]